VEGAKTRVPPCAHKTLPRAQLETIRAVRRCGPAAIHDDVVTPAPAAVCLECPHGAAVGAATQASEITRMDIVHRIGVKAPASKVYAALTTVDGLSDWWTRATSGDAGAGGRLAFRFQGASGEEIGGFDMDVLELMPQRKVLWKVKDGPAEWVGTDIEFVLSQQDGETVVMFGHRHWREAGEFMAHCSTKWATFLLSLRDLLETGHGRPAPDDLKISSWH
jgi:uncharacterized protein YndB with AHSA1/START domain